MKTLFILLALTMPALSQSGTNHRHGIGGGKDYTESSGVYVARTPYVLEWRAEEKARMGTVHSGWTAKVTESSVHVFDVDSGQIIASRGWGPLSGRVSVPQGGRHRVQVYSLGRWHANIIEDREALLRAEREGRLKPGVVLSAEERAQSIVGRRETVAAATAVKIAEFEREKAMIKPSDPARISKLNAVDEKIRLVHVVAARASSVADFDERLKAVIP